MDRLTYDQIGKLTVYQRSAVFHPYTCPRHDELNDHVVLIPTATQWLCGMQTCSYTQAYSGFEESILALPMIPASLEEFTDEFGEKPSFGN